MLQLRQETDRRSSTYRRHVETATVYLLGESANVQNYPLRSSLADSLRLL